MIQHARPRLRARTRSILSIVAATGLALTGAVAIATAPGSAPSATAAPVAAAQVETCPPDGQMPPLGNDPTFTDSGIAVFVGGDYTADANAAESEGLLVVTGDATFARESGGGFDVGSAGVGSGITPPQGDPMLQVGGDVTVTAPNTLRVGLLVGGGLVKAGATVTGTIDANGIAPQQNLTAPVALDPHAGFGDVITAASSQFAGLAANGIAQTAGNRVEFIATGGEGMQVFDLTTAQLDGANEFVFQNVPAKGPILVNVTGASTSFSPTDIRFGADRVDDGAQLGNASSRILWNFVDATNVTIGGSSQFIGSILAPAADVDVTASTNGRVYVGGDFRTHGSGNEQHNYPWVGGGPLGCVTESAEVGGFRAQKTFADDGKALVPDATEFTLRYSYELDGETVTGTLTLLADGTVVDGPHDLPAGLRVDFEEIDLPELAGVEWGKPVLSHESIVIAADLVSTITVTNTATETAPAVGGFGAKKLIDGGGAELVPDSSEFTLVYRYQLDGEAVSGALKLLADGTPVDGPQNLPHGTVVEFVELTPPDLEGLTWTGSEISPRSLTIGDAVNPLVTVTNTAEEGDLPLGGFSARKLIVGEAAGAVPAGTEFALAYWYEVDGEPIEGELRLPADGSLVAGPQNVPAGTVVSFEEVDLPTITGVEWLAPELSATEVTIAEGQTVELTVTNTAEPGSTPTPPTETPGTEAPAPGGGLASTGVEGLTAAIAAAAVLLVAGAVLLLVRRRRTV